MMSKLVGTSQQDLSFTTMLLTMQCSWAVRVYQHRPPTLEAHKQEPGPMLAPGMLLESTAEELPGHPHDCSFEHAARQAGQLHHPAMRSAHEQACAFIGSHFCKVINYAAHVE